MNALFLKLLNMSVKAGIIVLAIVVLRLLFKKAPKWMHCLLWVMVAVRLVVPVSFGSSFSVFNAFKETEVVSQKAELSEATGWMQMSLGAIITSTGTTASENVSDDTVVSSQAEGASIPYLAIIWLVGVAAMLAYSAYSYLCIKKKVRFSVPSSKNVYICDEITTPFILGILIPRIFVPSNIRGEALSNVLAHERAHIERRDYWWKPIAFLMLSVYWFNPLMWIAYVLFCKDIELACDEHVIKSMNKEAIAAYSSTLLECSISQRRIAACPLAFGENSVKTRIKSILNYKKPGFFVVVAAVIVCIIAGVVLLTDAKADQKEPEIQPEEQVVVSSVAESVEDKTEENTEENTEEPEPQNEDLSLMYQVFDEAGNVEVSGEDVIEFMNSDGTLNMEFLHAAVNAKSMAYRINGKEGRLYADFSFVAEDNQAPLPIWIEDENGETLWSTEIWLPHMGWDAYYYLNEDGTDYIIEYYPEESQGMVHYSFKMFTFDENGEILLKHEYSAKSETEISAFEEDIAPYRDRMELLASTIEFEVKAGDCLK